MKRSILIAVILILVAFGIWSTVSKPQTPDTIKLGALYAQTGVAAKFGELSIAGIRDGVAYFQSQHPEVSVELILEDTAADPKQGVSGATKLLSVDKVDAAVVGMSGVSAAVAPLADQYSRLIISDAAGYGLTKGYTNLVQNFMPSLGDVAGQINGRSEWKRVAVVYINDEFGSTWNGKIKTSLQGKDVGSFPFDSKATTFATDALKVKQFAPDVIVVIGYGPALNQALADLKLQGVTAPHLAYLACTLPGVLSDPRYSLEGHYSYEYPQIANPEIALWLEARGVKNPSTFYAVAFENTLLALTAVAEAGQAGALGYLKTNPVSGLYGSVQFNESGVVERDLKLTKIVGGQCVTGE